MRISNVTIVNLHRILKVHIRPEDSHNKLSHILHSQIHSAPPPGSHLDEHSSGKKQDARIKNQEEKEDRFNLF